MALPEDGLARPAAARAELHEQPRGVRLGGERREDELGDFRADGPDPQRSWTSPRVVDAWL
jgi:hypothetical protein